MTKDQKIILLRIIISIVLLVVCIFIPLDGWIKLVIFIVPYILIGYDIFIDAFRNIFNGSFLDEKFLMFIASVGAFIIGEYPEAVAVLIFYQIGNLFESYSVGKSRKSIAELMDIRPDYAVVIKDNEPVRVDPEEVNIGDIIQIDSGEKIPLDCRIIKGETSINNVALTGESLPVDVKVGDIINSGAVNITGTIYAEVTKIYSESTASKILDLVENASSKKAKSEKFITKFSKYYTPIVVGLAVLLFLVPSLITGNWFEWLHRALIFLVVSCPCALVISVPLTFFSGIGAASKLGILVKGSNYFESISEIDTLVLDKTGTLTEGKFEITDVIPIDISKDKLLYYAAKAESHSNHPIAQSIVKSNLKTIEYDIDDSFEEIPGRGVKASFEGHTVYIGNRSLMDLINIDISEDDKVGTHIYVSLDNRFVGTIIINDKIKDDAKSFISGIKETGINDVYLLTGDHKAIANKVAEKLGIDNVRSELLPEDKVEIVRSLIDEKKKVAFIGDGINDAPVISVSKVGYAMGGLGSAAAIEAADVVIMDDKLNKVIISKNLSKKVFRIVKENIIFALSVKFIVLILGALGIANMWLALFADVGVSVIAIINAMRAMSTKNLK